MRVPFDSMGLAAVVAEAQELVGGRLQRIVQWDELTIGLGIYRSRETWLLLSADASYARAHMVSQRREGLKEPPPFCMALRKYVLDATVTKIAQRGLDRILEITLSSAEGDFLLIAELMGKHSNIVLCDSSHKVLGSAKIVGLKNSKRPIIPGRPYSPPPFEPRPSLLDAKAQDDLSRFDGASPFLIKLVKAGMPLDLVQQAILSGRWSPVFCDGHGAYPLSLEPIGLAGEAVGSISQALERHFDQLVSSDRVFAERASLATQLKRVSDARERALVEIDKALATASRARARQEQAELILAYQSQIQLGASSLEAVDYSGNAVVVPLDPDKTAVENANLLFEKAKKSKQGAAEVARSRETIAKDFEEIDVLRGRLQSAASVGEIEQVRAEADRRRWLHSHVVARTKEERPYQGHSIREALSPNGWTVLYGENATSNDYLTTKVARPNDLWFHVRGVTSAHVVLLTQNRPNSVQMEDMMFAAKIAVNKSASKHASYVTVDYVLKKHVRKARKSAPGAVTYSQEKTLHVES